MIPRLSLLAIALLNTHNAMSTPAFLGGDRDYPSRATGQFLTGHDRQLAGFVDGMLPFFQNKEQIFFADATFMAGRYDRTMYSGGLGYRGIMDTKLSRGILGVYGFVDYFQTAQNSEFWQLNPGLEWLNENYEGRLQAYIPVSKRTHTYSNTFATQIPNSVLNDSGQGIGNLAYVTGHSLFDTPVALQEQAGPGVELEVGRFLNVGKGLWLRGGGYYFNYQNAKSVGGGQANIEMVMSHNASLLIQDNYDNQNKNMFSVGIRVNLGGSPAAIGTLEQRMTSPIIRHTARQSFGEAAPTRQTFAPTGPTFLAADNIAFFSPTGVNPIGAGFVPSSDECTAENPCLVITDTLATDLNTLLPNTKLYFASGTYDLHPNVVNSNNWVDLKDGQSVWGRRTGWLQAAHNAERPLINGGVFWDRLGSASGAMYNMRVDNQNQLVPAFFFGAVIGVGAKNNLTVEDSDINVFGTSSTSLNTYGIYAQNMAVVSDSKTTVTGLTVNNDNVIGVQGSIVKLLNMDITVSGTSQNGGSNTSFGVLVVGGGESTISNSRLSVTGTSGNTTNNTSYGIQDTAAGNIVVSNSTIVVSGTAGADNTSYGIQESSSGGATVSNSNIDVNGTAGAGNSSYGIQEVGNGDATVSASNITVNGTAGTNNLSDGIRENGNGNATLSNSRMSVNGSAVAANQIDGVLLAANGNLTVISSLITLTGSAGTNNLSFGTWHQGNGLMTVTNSQIDVNGTGNTNSSFGSRTNGGIANALITNSKITVNGSAQGTNESVGVEAANDIATLVNSSVTVNGSSNSGISTVYGVDATSIIFNGTPSSINVTANGPTQVVDAVKGTVTNSNGSQCTTNGNTVTCGLSN